LVVGSNNTDEAMWVKLSTWETTNPRVVATKTDKPSRWLTSSDHATPQEMSQASLLGDQEAVKEKLVKKMRATKEKKPKMTGAVDVFEAYSQAYFERYNTHPLRNANIMGRCVDLVKKMGKDHAIEVVKFYLNSNDAFFVKSMHDIRHVQTNYSGLSTQLKTGMTMTFDKAKGVERKSQNAEVYNAAKNGML
jgi:hypothetical protein